MLSLNIAVRRLGTTALTIMLGLGSVAPVWAQNPGETPTVAVAVETDGVVKTQDPASTPEPAPQKDATPRAVDLLPTDRVGVDPSRTVKMSLHDAILMALTNNVDIEVERGNVQISQQDLLGARGAYDPILSANLNFTDSVTPTAQTFIGAADGAFKRKALEYNGGLRGAIKTGATYAIDFSNSRTTNSAASAGLNPQYSSELRFSFTQPLMRDYFSSRNERFIKLSKKQLTLSDAVFRQRVINTIAQVQAAYWDLVFAVRNSQIAREAVELADVTLRNNQRQVEVGTLAPIEIVSAKADLESRKDSAISALQQVTVAENALKALMLGDPSNDMWNAAIETTERVEFTPLDIQLASAVDTAIKNRPELEQLRLRQELKDIDTQFFRNQQKPQVDFVTSYTLSGLAGTTNRPSDNNRLAEDILRFQKQIAQPAFSLTPSLPTLDQQSGIPGRFIGGYGAALSNLFSFDFHTFAVGVNFNFTLRNRTARANVGRALAETRQLKAQERQMLQSVQVEVRNAVQAVVSARQRVEAARAARIAAEAQLKGEEQKYAAGISNNFLVLDRQTRLSTARGQEIRALTDYNKGIAELQRVMSTTLTANGIQIPTDPTAPDAPAPASTTTDDPNK